MQSAIYSGYVWHHRHRPRTHKFKYRVFMMYLDLAELEEVLAQSRWWSINRFSPARFCRSDYFKFPEDELRDPAAQDPAVHNLAFNIDTSVRAAVENKLGMRPTGAIRVLTNLRYFGYLINPISCYYCFDESDENLQALLIEVTNTPWGERTHYVLDLRQYQSGQPVDFDKDMHVSPFMPMRMIYRWKGMLPGKKLSYSLASFTAPQSTVEGTQYENRQPDTSAQFDSGVKFKRIEISPDSLGRVLWQYPLMTGKVALAIYWQAFKLWLKRIPFVPHPSRLDRAGK